MKNFILIGAGGYIAPRHMRAIKDTGNNLLAALDKHDSVGILDSFFPKTNFFTEFERFDRHVEKLKRTGTKTDYASVCSPNYLHDSHIRFGLRVGAHVICEKPIVLNPWNVDALMEIEKETGKNVYTILQLRHHPSIIQLKKEVEQTTKGAKRKIDLTYVTSRGNWYQTSWKGNIEKSGGIATNIGVHFFDMLLWIFGDVEKSIVEKHGIKNASGHLELEKASVNWKLSIDEADLPQVAVNAGLKTYRALIIDGEEFEFSNGFSELHTRSYEEIIAGRGFRLSETRKTIQLVHDIRNFNRSVSETR